MNMRDRIAKRLYDHWREEDVGNEYVEWEILPDKQTWRDRADAILDALSGPDEAMMEVGIKVGGVTSLATYLAMIAQAKAERDV